VTLSMTLSDLNHPKSSPVFTFCVFLHISRVTEAKFFKLQTGRPY